MRKNLFIIIIITLAVSACSINLPAGIDPSIIGLEQGSGNVISKEFKVSDFHRVTLNGAGELEITFGREEGLSVSAEDNVIEMITADVEEGTLTLSYSNPLRVIPTEPVKFELVARQVDGVTVNGAGKVSIKDIKGDDLDVTFNGAGQVIISGRVGKQEVTFNGAGKYQGEDLLSSEAEVEINGLGSGVVWASEVLEATINGAGELKYFGSPRLTQQVNGAGSVRGLGERK